LTENNLKMGKKIFKAILIGIILLFFALCVIPNPLSEAKAADGGTKIYTTIIPVVSVIDWNKISMTPHGEEANPNSENYDPDYPRGETTMGKQVYIFGICVYDGRYTVEGIHTR
jgi:hypothetical protein